MSLRPPFDGDVSVIVSTAALLNPPMSFDEKREELAAAHQLIQAKYDAGIPFFTKKLFHDVVRQLESNVDQKVSVTGLDGFAVHFPIETGNVYQYHPYGHDFACFITKPRLEYHTIENLLAVQDPNYYSVCRAYLPVEVVHSTEVRDINTNELVDIWPTADCATVKLRFEQTKRSLEASEHFAQINSILTAIAFPSGIDKIVAIGCSTMTWPEDDCALPSLAQHTLALTIRDLLTNLYGEGAREIKCYAQDPIYSPIDQQVLVKAGFTVIDDPRAFLEVDEASVVISIDPDIPVRQIVADIARPAMMIWHKVAVSDQFSADPVSSRVMQMMEEYREVLFPVQNDHFGNVAIYVRKQDAGGE